MLPSPADGAGRVHDEAAPIDDIRAPFFVRTRAGFRHPDGITWRDGEMTMTAVVAGVVAAGRW